MRTYDDINRFREEIEAIKAVLTQQKGTLDDLKSILFKQSPRRDGRIGYYSAQTDDSLRHQVTEKLREQVQQRLDNFTELQMQADRIQGLVSLSKTALHLRRNLGINGCAK